MAKEETLKQKLSKLRTAIKANSKDDKLASKLISDILSVKGQMCIPSMPIGECGKELGKFEGEFFCITKYENAVVYHVYNRFYVVVRPNDIGLYETLVDYVDNQETYKHLEGDLKEIFERNLEVTAYVLGIPSFAFSDVDFCYEIATKVVQFLNEKTSKIDNVELPEEDFKANNDFIKSELAMDNVRKVLED